MCVYGGESANTGLPRRQLLNWHVSVTAVVSGDSGDDIYEQLKVVIEEQTGSLVWISSSEPL